MLLKHIETSAGIDEFLFSEEKSISPTHLVVNGGHTLAKLGEIEAEIHDKAAGNAAVKKIWMESWHDELLIYASKLVENPEKMACGILLAAHVAASPYGHCQHSHIERIFDFFDQRVRAFEDYPEIDAQELAGYFCAARMVSFESRFSQRLHGYTLQLLRDLAGAEDPDLHGKLFVIFAEKANEFPTGIALLTAHYDEIVAVGRKVILQSDRFRDEVADTLKAMVAFSGNLAAGLPASSELYPIIARQFSQQWGELYSVDSDKAGKMLTEYFAKPTLDRNEKFDRLIREKAVEFHMDAAVRPLFSPPRLRRKYMSSAAVLTP